MDKQQKSKILKRLRLNLAILVFFVGIMLAGIVTMRYLLLRNSQEMGGLLIQKYSSDEDKRVSGYETMLSFGTKYIEDREKKGDSLEDIKEGLYPYLDGFCEMNGTGAVQVYGVVDGTIISNNAELENMPGYDYRQATWYKMAQEAQGGIIYTDTYSDYRTGKPNITIAKRADGSDSVLSLDLFLEDFHDKSGSLGLPSDASYYLCDAKGTLLYYDTPADEPYEEYQDFIRSFWDEIKEEPEDLQNRTIRDIDGGIRNYYVCSLNNGWRAVLTISQDNVLEGMSVYLWVVVGLGVAALGVIIFMAVRDYHHRSQTAQLQEEQKKIEHEARIYQRAVGSMAAAYREIYYVNLKTYSCRLISPRSTQQPEVSDYAEEVEKRCEEGAIQKDSREQVEQFMKPETICRELEDKDYVELKYRRRTDKGGYEWCLTSITAAEREDKEVTGITIAIRSIEKMVKQEEDKRELLNIALQRARAANEAKSEFLSRMSHDIRTPLNAILGLTVVARMHIKETERLEDVLNKIEMSGEHLLGLINEILDLSKIENGKMYLNQERFSLDDALDNLITFFQEQMEEKNIKMKLENHMEHHVVIGDEGRMSRIFINILGNAVKYTPNGGNVSLTITEEPQILGHSMFHFIFKDTGMGMSKEFLEHVFEPFARETETHRQRIEGTGLGMPIALNLAKLMGGDILVESRPGAGSTFEVMLQLELGETETAAAEEKKKNCTAESRPDYTDKRALVVEDNYINVEVLKEMLDYIGLKSDVVNNGREAVDRITETEPGYYDIVFMDIRMPVMNGYEAAELLRSSEREDIKSIPVIAMTADVFEEDIRRCREAGMNEHVAKPIDQDTLYEVLAQYLM